MNNPIIFVDPSGHFTEEEMEAMTLQDEKDLGMGDYADYTIDPTSSTNGISAGLNITVTPTSMDIVVYVSYKGAYEDTISGSQKTYQEAINEGINGVEGQYTVFDEKMDVTVTVHDLTNSQIPAVVGITGALIIKVAESSGRSFFRSGLLGLNWSTDSKKMIKIYHGFAGQMRTEGKVISTAMHEFMHALGVGDAYYGVVGKDLVATGEYDPNGVMLHSKPGDFVTDKDIAMATLAWKYNTWQNQTTYTDGRNTYYKSLACY